MNETLIKVLNANIFFIYIIWTSFMIEMTLGLYLLTRGLWLSKKEDGSLFYRLFIPFLYFGILNSVIIYDKVIKREENKEFSYLLWFIVTILLSFWIYKFIDMLQEHAIKKNKRIKRLKT